MAGRVAVFGIDGPGQSVGHLQGQVPKLLLRRPQGPRILFHHFLQFFLQAVEVLDGRVQLLLVGGLNGQENHEDHEGPEEEVREVLREEEELQEGKHYSQNGKQEENGPLVAGIGLPVPEDEDDIFKEIETGCQHHDREKRAPDIGPVFFEGEEEACRDIDEEQGQIGPEEILVEFQGSDLLLPVLVKIGSAVIEEDIGHQGAGKEICGIEDIFEEGRPVVIDGPGPEDVKGIGRVERDDKAQKLPVLLRLHRILDPHVDGNEEENEKRQDFEIGYIHGIPLPSLGYMTNIEQDIFCGLSLAGGQRILYTSAVVPRTYLNPVYHY